MEGLGYGWGQREVLYDLVSRGGYCSGREYMLVCFS